MGKGHFAAENMIPDLCLADRALGFAQKRLARGLINAKVQIAVRQSVTP
jgi:hypothetical protein